MNIQKNSAAFTEVFTLIKAHRRTDKHLLTLCSHSVGSGRKQFTDHSSLEARLCTPERSSETCASSPHNNSVVGVVYHSVVSVYLVWSVTSVNYRQTKRQTSKQADQQTYKRAGNKSLCGRYLVCKLLSLVQKIKILKTFFFFLNIMSDHLSNISKPIKIKHVFF